MIHEPRSKAPWTMPYRFFTADGASFGMLAGYLVIWAKLPSPASPRASVTRTAEDEEAAA